MCIRDRLKNNTIFSMSKQIGQLVNIIDQNSKFIHAKRSVVTFGPAEQSKTVYF
jgi:hypothetical protein